MIRNSSEGVTELAPVERVHAGTGRRRITLIKCAMTFSRYVVCSRVIDSSKDEKER
jgi:hypothetical protein